MHTYSCDLEEKAVEFDFNLKLAEALPASDVDGSVDDIGELRCVQGDNAMSDDRHLKKVVMLVVLFLFGFDALGVLY